MSGARVDGDVRTDVAGVYLDRGACRLIDDIGCEGRSFDDPTPRVRDVPGVNPGSLLRVRVERDVRLGRACDALELEPVDISVDRKHRHAGARSVANAEARPGDRAGQRIEQQPNTSWVCDRAAPDPPAPGPM